MYQRQGRNANIDPLLLLIADVVTRTVWARYAYRGCTLLAVRMVSVHLLKFIKLRDKLGTARRSGAEPRVERVLRIAWRMRRRVKVVCTPIGPASSALRRNFK